MGYEQHEHLARLVDACCAMSSGYPTVLGARPITPLSPGVKLAFQLHPSIVRQPMDNRQSDYPQSGTNLALQTTDPSITGDAQRDPFPDQQPAAHYQQGQDSRSANFSSAATPNSEYGIAPSSARSGTFPDYQRPYNPPLAPGASQQQAMAQATSPSMPLNTSGSTNGQPASSPNMRSDQTQQIDPSIAAATSPTYPAQHQYSPYTPSPEMAHYPGHPGVYGRPEWAGGQYASPIYTHSPVSSSAPLPALVSPVWIFSSYSTTGLLYRLSELT